MRAALLAMLFVAATAIGCGGETTIENAPPGTVEPGAPVSADRTPAPAIAGVSLTGERISLEGFRGRPVFINVWSSW